MQTKPRTLAIITARGGSKRIPRKNIRPFHGRPIIHYPIQAALDSGVFDEVMVSTEDQEIAHVARESGAKVPFLRSPETATDFAMTVEVLSEVLQTYQQQGEIFTHFCCLYPTAVFVTPEQLREAMVLQSKPCVDSVIAVTRFGFPIQRALKIENGFLSMFEPKYLMTRSQDLQPAFHDCGQFFFCEVDSFLKTRKVLTERTAPMEIPESQTQDIDNEEDWRLAEVKFELLRGRGQR